MSIGKRIRSRRLELGLTQEELAARMGYSSKTTINKIELGINDIPLSKVRQFAGALSTTESFLMEWDESSSSSSGSEFSADEQQLLEAYRSLNVIGRREAAKRVEELTEIERYIKIGADQSEAVG